MATLKHLGSKNADYGAAEQYLLFEHDEFTMKPVLDENGRLIPREDYRLSTLNCGGEDFALAVHGRGAASITRILVEEKVPTPGWLNYERYGTFANKIGRAHV